MTSKYDLKQSIQRNAWLDVCRSVAIILVILSHGRHFLTPVWGQTAILRIGGFLGVELFFVLSGFLVGGILQRCFIQSNGQQSWLTAFLLRRWLKTLPTYYLFLIVNALMIIWGITPGQISQLAPMILFTQNLAWQGPVEFGEAWSLAVEEVFYLLFPLCLFLTSKIVSNRKNVFIVVTLALLFASLIGRIFVVNNADPSWDEGVRKVVIYRFDSLMLGVLVGWLLQEFAWMKNIPTQVIGVIALLMTIAVTIVYFCYEPTRDDSYFYRVWLFPMTSLAAVMTIWSGLNGVRLPRLLHIPSEYLAHGSYALYLVHMPVFFLINYYSNGIFGGPWIALTRWTCFVVGSLALAAVVTRYVEQPILNWRDRRVPR